MLSEVRAVIDANIRVSAFLGVPGAPFRIVNAALAGEFTLVTSEPLLSELREVLLRPEIARRHRHTAHEIAAFVEDLGPVSESVEVTGATLGCRDPKDDVVVETALAGVADVLVTLDQDFAGSPLVLDAFRKAGVRICTPSSLPTSWRQPSTNRCRKTMRREQARRHDRHPDHWRGSVRLQRAAAPADSLRG